MKVRGQVFSCDEGEGGGQVFLMMMVRGKSFPVVKVRGQVFPCDKSCQGKCFPVMSKGGCDELGGL